MSQTVIFLKVKPTPPPTSQPPVPLQPGVGSGQPGAGSGQPGAGSGDSSLCGGDASIDAIFKTKDGSSYVFKGD